MIKSITLLIFNYSFILNILIIFIIIIPIKNIKFHPIILLIILISSTIIITIKINLIFKNWIPFILFLTVIGGLIIIYIYITRLANNEFFKINFFKLLNLFFKIIILLILLIFLFKKLNFISWNNQDCWNLINFLEKKNELNFREIYNLNYISILTLIFYLYFSIICIINICYKFNSPLRQLYLYE